MKKALILAFFALSVVACSPSRQLPAAPQIGSYYDSTFVKLQQEKAKDRATRKFERGKLTKPTVTAIGMTAFGIYCILAWRFDIE